MGRYSDTILRHVQYSLDRVRHDSEHSCTTFVPELSRRDVSVLLLLILVLLGLPRVKQLSVDDPRHIRQPGKSAKHDDNFCFVPPQRLLANS